MAKPSATKTTLQVLAILLLLFVASIRHPALAQDQEFDLSHARQALHYFDSPSPTNISHVAFTSPARQLAQLYNVKNRDDASADKSTFETSQTLLNKTPTIKQLDHVKALITLIADNKQKQSQCIASALEHLPQNQFENPLYIVWAGGQLVGEDNIINLANTSMLDITAQKYEINPQEIWTDCIHALHHAGMNKINPIPFSLDSITRSDELLAFIEHTILLEGSADYAVTSKLPPRMFDVSPFDPYTKLKWKLFGGSGTLTPEDWELVDDMLQSARHMGSEMAREIDNKLGRKALIDAYSGGAASFFHVYKSLN